MTRNPNVPIDAALLLAELIDLTLEFSHRHYRNRAGRLLTKFDEVVRAILDDDLLVPEA